MFQIVSLLYLWCFKLLTKLLQIQKSPGYSKTFENLIMTQDNSRSF